MGPPAGSLFQDHAERDPDICTGTEKKTMAKKLGQVYYDRGFLSSAEVVESRTPYLVG